MMSGSKNFERTSWDTEFGGTARPIAMTFAALIAANVATWIWAWIAFADRPALLGIAALAYTFGLRHAFDADHIAAIDNVVRKLLQQGKANYSVGLFFSLGHSTVVVLACLVFAAAATTLRHRLEALHELYGIVGTAVSALFLFGIGVLNLFGLKTVWIAFRRARRGARLVDDDLNALLAGQGMLSRLLRPLFQLVSSAWHMYPIGLLFALGFDTATEIGLLGVSAHEAARGLSLWSMLVLPALFTGGMSLMDTIDSTLMSRAYGWASAHPIRRVWYNLTITTASVAVALFVGGVEAFGLISDRFGLKGPLWYSIADLNANLSYFGYAIVAIFLGSWFFSALLYRRARIGRISVAPD